MLFTVLYMRVLSCGRIVYKSHDMFPMKASVLHLLIVVFNSSS